MKPGYNKTGNCWVKENGDWTITISLEWKKIKIVYKDGGVEWFNYSYEKPESILEVVENRAEQIAKQKAEEKLKRGL